MRKILTIVFCIVIAVSIAGCGNESITDHDTPYNNTSNVNNKNNAENTETKNAEIEIENVSQSSEANLTSEDFVFSNDNGEKYSIDFDCYYGFAKEDVVTFELAKSFEEDRIYGEFVLPRNLTIDSTIDDYISAYDINETNSTIQVWKNMSYFYSFDRDSIGELTKNAEWADILIAWFQTTDGEWHRMSSHQVMNLMKNTLEGECEAVYAVNIDCKNPIHRNSVIITYSTLENMKNFNQ